MLYLLLNFFYIYNKVFLLSKLVYYNEYAVVFLFCIGSFDFGSLIIKSYNITSYSRVANSTGYSFLCGLYLFSLFL